jgi:hypothetical protein
MGIARLFANRTGDAVVVRWSAATGMIASVAFSARPHFPDFCNLPIVFPGQFFGKILALKSLKLFVYYLKT